MDSRDSNEKNNKKQEPQRHVHPFFNKFNKDIIRHIAGYLNDDIYQFRKSNYELFNIFNEEYLTKRKVDKIKNLFQQIMTSKNPVQRIHTLLEKLGATIPPKYNITGIFIRDGSQPGLVNIIGDTFYKYEPAVVIKDLKVSLVFKAAEVELQREINTFSNKCR